ncbi:MAG TPA: SRPBCC family protein [Actinomycetota bacterium]
MARFEEHVDVGTSVEETFRYITDQKQVASWNDHVQRVEVDGGGPVAPGTIIRQHRRRGNREFVLTFQVIDHESPRRHALRGEVFGTSTTMEFGLEPRGSGTRVSMAATVEARGLKGVLAPLVARQMRKSTVAALTALRERLGAA